MLFLLSVMVRFNTMTLSMIFEGLWGIIYNFMINKAVYEGIT